MSARIVFHLPPGVRPPAVLAGLGLLPGDLVFDDGNRWRWRIERHVADVPTDAQDAIRQHARALPLDGAS